MTSTDKHNSRISIQVGLSGYSFIRHIGPEAHVSGWMGADKVFTCADLQRRYDEVEIGIFTPKFTLVPAHFHSPEKSREILGEVVSVGDSDSVNHVTVSEFGAVLVYSSSIGGTLPRVLSQTVLKTDGSTSEPRPCVYYMLNSLRRMSEYNKIVAAFADGWIYLVIAQGSTLLLCNCFRAPDFTTAEYFIFLAMKRLQLNPEVSSITFTTPLKEEEEMSLYRYFRGVDAVKSGGEG